MRKVWGSLSLLILLLNMLLTPVTYAGEYEELIVIISDKLGNQVEENGEEDKAPEFSVEEKIGEEENTGGTVDDGDILTGDIAELDTGEIEDIIGGDEVIITGFDVEDDTGISLDILSGASEVSFGSGDVSEDVVGYNSESIIGEKTYNDVTVRVEALSGIFPEGTELVIEPIKWWNLSNLKDQLVVGKEEIKEDTTVVAFDITFIYSGEEVQPKDGEKVKVTFDYSNNEALVKADNNDEREVKVYHVEDKDEEGNELEKGEEKIVDVTNVKESVIEGVAVADGESFSIYAVVIITGDATSVSIVHNLNGGYWMEDYSMTPKTIEYTCDSSCTTNTHYRTPSRTGFMFMGWFTDELGTTKRKGEAEDGMDVYAKWQEFGDLDIIFLGNQSNSGHYTLMDRNMGAKVVYDGNYTSPNDGSRGYYYQWGNNYGFDEYNSNNDPLSPIEPKTENVSSYTSSEPYYSFVFRGKDDQTIKNWMTSLNKKLRGDDGNNEVSRQGPCPDGYHIPTKAEYESILSFYNNLKNNSTEKLTKYLLMPPAGIRDRGYSDLGKVFNSSYYRYTTSSWNNNDYTNKAVWFFGADSDNANSVKLDKEWSANGLSARCFKNNTKLNDRYNIYLNGGENAIISILSGVVQSIQEPYKEFYDFDGWYTSSDFEGEPIEVGSTLLPGSSLYAKWISYDIYSITYNLNGGFMKFSNNTRELNIQEYAENTNAFTLKNPVKLNSVFIGWSGTNLSSPTLTVTIPKGSVGNRVYEALYDCEPGYVFDENNDCVGIRNADGTLNFDEWEYGTVDFGVGDTKITMLDRNLGATTNDISDSGSIGFYYKWGNNYGFSTNHTSKYGATNTKIADISGYGPGALSGYYLSHDWIYGGEKSAAGHWSSIVNFDLWGDITDTLQARQGPCPDEYHIPSDSEVSSVINILSEFAGTSTGIQCIDLYGNKRKCFQNLVKLPDSGLIKSNSSTSSASDTNRIFLRTSSDYNNATMTAFHSTQSQVDMTIGERSSAAAMQVRCFKNLGEITVKYNFNGGYYGDNIYSKPDIEDDRWNLSKQTISPLSLSMKRDNSVFSGWYMDSEFKKEFTGGTILPYATQDITFYAKFECDTPYVSSVDGKSCIFNNNTITYDYQSHSGVNENTSIDVSYGTEITLPSEGITSQKGYNFIGWTTELGGTEPISNVQTIVGDVTFYPIFKKDSIEKSMTFNLNGSKGFTYSGTNYSIDTILPLCTIEERYNNQEDKTYCEAIIQLPTITGSDNTPYVSGWSTGLDIAAISVGTNLKITAADVDDIVNFYAQTYSMPKTYRLNYEYRTGVILSAVSSGSCEITGTFNGVAQSGSCNIELPQLGLKTGFKDPLWYKGNHGYTGVVEVFGIGMDNGLNLEDGDVLTGIAHAKDDVKYVVKHYYQMLNSDETQLLENQYKSGRIEEKAGLAHAIIELSGEKFDDLMGYTYYTGTIQTTADEVDISGITTVTTGEINPEGTLVITLFYTRDTYKVDWIDQGSIVKTENSLPYGVKVNHYRPADPTKDTTPSTEYTFAGWYDEDDDLLTGDTLLETGTIYTSKYNEITRTYTIIWKNSTGTVLETDIDVAYGSMPSYDGEEPTSGLNAHYTYYFSGWTPQTGMVVKDQVYTAVYNSLVNQYAITFVDEDGSVLKEAKEYDYDTPVTDIEKPSDPTKTATAQYTYTFAGWNPTVHDVTGTQVYTATYSSTVNKYTVLWKNRNGAEIETDENVGYGTKPKYDGNTPTSGETVEYQYRFSGWTPTITNETIIEGDTVYTATYEPIKRKYEITWKDYNDQTIDITEVEYGVIPTHANPIRTGHDFNVWDPIPVKVTGSTSYKATYTINQYTVTPEKGDGVANILGGGTYDYGTEIVLTGIAKEGYHFEGGENVKEFNILVPAKNITIILTAQPNTYYVHFKNNGGEGVMNDQAFIYDQKQALTPNAYTRNGYSFVSWTDGEGGIFKDKAVVKNLVTSGIINLIAQWIEGDVPGPTPPTPEPSGGGSSGGGRIIDKNTDDKEHDSAEDKQQEEIKDDQTKKDQIIQTGEDVKQITGDTPVIIPESLYHWTEEELTAYQFAYKYGITTLAPENAAMPDEYVQRGHMAKMVVNYALNVLHWKLPDKLPKQCKWKDGPNAWESQEIKDYAGKACALGIMGINMKYFQPKKYVNRAQFGTIIGRLLRGKLTSKPYYAGHLSRLKERGIMTQIENPENRIEIRKWAWLMFMRMEKYQ